MLLMLHTRNKQQQTRDILRYSITLWWYLYILQIAMAATRNINRSVMYIDPSSKKLPT